MSESEDTCGLASPPSERSEQTIKDIIELRADCALRPNGISYITLKGVWRDIGGCIRNLQVQLKVSPTKHTVTGHIGTKCSDSLNEHGVRLSLTCVEMNELEDKLLGILLAPFRNRKQKLYKLWAYFSYKYPSGTNGTVLNSKNVSNGDCKCWMTFLQKDYDIGW